MTKILLLAAFSLSVWQSSATAQTPIERRNAPLTAAQLQPDETINIDGKLDDSVWQRIKPMNEFYEYRPRDAVAAKFSTEAKIAYDKHALYVAINALDPEPNKINAPIERRDKVYGAQYLVSEKFDGVRAIWDGK